ncbi:MAG: hypothetical protein LBG58_12650 [Planctomycetaceae bacterium]|jgi:hypothetical protein|nr:hypothetical protein [Planctomycetaceae bacterium]
MQIKLITVVLFFIGFFQILFFQILEAFSSAEMRSVLERGNELMFGTPQTYVRYCFLELLIGYLFPLFLIKILNVRHSSILSSVVFFLFYIMFVYGFGGFCAFIIHLIVNDLSTLNFRCCFFISFFYLFCGGNGLRLLKHYGCLEYLNDATTLVRNRNQNLLKHYDGCLEYLNGVKNVLYSVPVASTSFLKEAYLYERDEIRFAYQPDDKPDDKMITGRIVFHKVSAQRTRNERCCTVWHIDKAYDTLVEIENSDWSAEIKKNTKPHLRNDQNYHHYMIYLDSVGCFEFIADSWEVFE